MTDRLEIHELDPFDDVAFEAWHAAYWRAGRHDLGEAATLWTLPELRVQLRADDPSRRHGGYVARIGREVVGTGYVGLPLSDNLASADVKLDVVPERRRRGIGTAMLDRLESVARAAGRTLLDAEASWPHDRGTEGRDGTGWPAIGFADAHGYRLVLSDVQRALALPVDDALLADLAAAAAPHHAAYTLRTWVGPVPDELAESWVALSSSLMTEAPTGEREVEPEKRDVAVLRSNEALLVAQGRQRYHAAALDAAGEVVAYTDLVTPSHEPGRAYQWGTLVRRDHRGRRLGTAVKVANLRQLQAADPTIRRLTTYNAEVNAHMIAVNEQLGFRPVARLGEFQKRLA